MPTNFKIEASIKKFKENKESNVGCAILGTVAFLVA